MSRGRRQRKLIVQNPTGVPEGMPVLSFTNPDEDFYEGDVFRPRPGTTEQIIQRRIEQGYLRYDDG